MKQNYNKDFQYLVGSLVITKPRKKKKIPYGMFSPLEISEKEIDQIFSGWEKIVNELYMTGL